MPESVVPKDIAEKLVETLFQGDKVAAVNVTRKALASGVDPLALVQEAIIPSLVEVGRRFEALEIFLPELMQAGEIGSACSKVIEEELVKRGGAMRVEGVVVIGTVKGDIHDIGKNIVISLFKAHGYKVVDLGRDVSAIAFVEAAEANHADVIAASTLMSITRAGCREIAGLLRELNLSDKYHFIVGGGSLDQAYADEIGADGYAPTAAGAVELVKSVMSN